MNTPHLIKHTWTFQCFCTTNLCALFMTFAATGTTLPPGRHVAIGKGDTGLYLSLPGIQGASYEIQVKNSLSHTEWQRQGIVTGQDGITVYPLPASDSPSQFFRVLFPQPTIIAGEPALYAQGTGGEVIYVTGSFFYPGDVIRVGGLAVSNVVFLSPGLIRADLPPGLQPGRYDVEVSSGASGELLALLPDAIQVVDLASDANRLLYEPPVWPPAGPASEGKKGINAVNVKKSLIEDDSAVIIALLSKKGYDYYQAQSALNSAMASGNGHVTVLKAQARVNGHVTVLKGRDDDCDGFIAQAAEKGHVTVLKSQDQDCDGRDEDCDGVALLHLHSGEVQSQATDLAIPGQGLAFGWTRTYRSRTGEGTPQGNRWTHCYDVRCVPEPGDTAVWIYDGTGRKDHYERQPDGSYTCPEFFREGTFTGGVFRLIFADTGFWEFNPFGTSPAAGKLARIQDRNGNALTLSYDTAGRLGSLEDPSGRFQTLTYTTDGHIASVTDSSGRTVTYTYYAKGEAGGSPGDLKTVTSPPVIGTPNGNDFADGKTVTYTYTKDQSDSRANSLLLSVIDALTQTVVRCEYDLQPASATFQKCLSAQRAESPPTCVTYLVQDPSPNNRFATMRCLVNDPEGNVTETAFDTRNRCVSIREYAGRAEPGQPVTDTANRPVNKLRASDPDTFDTILNWNRDSLCLGGMMPGGAVISCVYEADLNPFTPARKRGDLRTFRQGASPGRDTDSDGDGVPDLTEITRQYTHDPRFGSEPSSRPGKKIYVGNLPYSAIDEGLNSGNGDSTGSSLTAKIVTDRDTGRSKGFAFVISTTDPKGNTATASYDGAGNCTRITGPNVVGNDPPIIDLTYDSHGQPISVTHPADAAGRRKIDTFFWHQGLVTQIVEDAASDGLQLTTAIERDSRGNATRLADPRGNDVLITYNALNQAMTVAKQTQGASFGERVKTRFTYDANNNLIGVVTDNRHSDGHYDTTNPYWETVIAYDTLKRPTLIAHELAHTVQQRVMTNQFVYDTADRLVLHRLPEAASGAEPDNVIASTYDERGLLFSEARAPGTGLSTVDRYDYDTDGNLTRISKIDSFAIKQSLLDYDGFNRRVRVTDAMGNVATRCFDANGNLTYERADGETTDQPGNKGNRRLAETRYSYDGCDRRIGQIYSFFDIFTQAPIEDGKSETVWVYAPNGQLLSVTNDNGSGTVFSYDHAGRIASVTDPKGNVTATSYDANGNVLEITQTDHSDVSTGEQLFTRSFVYDTLNRCVSASDNVSNTVTYAYDSCDRLESETDPAGNETVYGYDGLGRVIDTTHYDGAKERGITINTSHVEYRNNRLANTTDANSNTTAYAYDACDRCVAVTHADGTTESLIWSPRSNLERRTDANGTALTNTYDLCDRIVHRDIATGGAVMATTSFETFSYDGLGRLVAAANDQASLLYTYDSLGNRVSSSQDGLMATASFDGLGNRRRCSCPSGYFVSTTYDELNRPTAVSLQAPSASQPTTLANLAYDGADRLSRITRANGINTRIFWDGQQNSANATGDDGWQQVSSINHARAGGSLVVDQRYSAYDRNQNKVLRAMTAPWASGGSLVTNLFGYDKMHRLTRSRKSGAVVASDYDYVLDANGNRLQVTNNGILQLYTMDATLPEPADFQMNQYTDTPFGTDGYDARGNRVIRANSTASTRYFFDYADRLVQVDTLDPVGTTVSSVTYSYDPLGRRIGKTVISQDGLPPVTTIYLYDDNKDDDCDGLPDDDVLEVYRSGAVSSVSVLAGGSGGGAAAASYAATGRILSPPVALVNGAGEVMYTHCDDLGNVLALTDAAGNVVEHYDYEDFGEPRFFDASGTPQAGSAVGNDLLFRGMRWDAEIGLYYGHSKGGFARNPLYTESGSNGSNPLFERQLVSMNNNPAFHENQLQGSMPEHRAAGDGDKKVTWHECFICFAMDPSTGQTLGRDGTMASGGQSDRAFESNNPWTGNPVEMKKGTVKFFNEAKGFGFIKEEGGRHTPFHNKNGWESITYPSIRINTKISNALKTKHDTAKNSIGNIR